MCANTAQRRGGSKNLFSSVNVQRDVTEGERRWVPFEEPHQKRIIVPMHIVIGGLYLTVNTSTHEHVVIGRLYLTVKTSAHEHVVIGGLYLTVKTSTHEYAVIGRLLMDSQNLCP